MRLLMKNLCIFATLFTIVMLVNLPIISFDMMYQEQTTIYLANASIHTWGDLLNIYLHPTWLNINIPFFRPSGHFLIYQIFMPLLGWHNTLALNIISFTFLTLIGFFSIKLYRLLFPGFTYGALIAFSLYLMHPSLSISRLTFMHFDFAYVAFLVLSLYLFVLFCNKNNNKTRFEHYSLFISSLIIFALAITFKEPAIMLGPVMFCYFVISFHHRLFQKDSLLILFTITASSALLSWYLFLSWPSLNYAVNSFNLSHSLGTANVLIKDLFAVNSNLIPYGTLPFEAFAWRTTLFTNAARDIMWISFWLFLAAAFLIIREKSSYRKPILFLLISSLLFMLLPLSWASGAPWHHSLTLICYSSAVGFSAEFFLRRLTFTRKHLMFFCTVFALVITWTGVTVNFANITKYYLEPNGFLGLSLNRNAIHSPPALKTKLDKDSILVVEDSSLHNDYFFGNGAYPLLLFLGGNDYEAFIKRQKNFYVQFQHTYNGNLFRYAYLMPELKEELYPFQIEAMEDIPNEIIYNWLKNFNHLACVGYDAAANWQDKTQAFKTALTKQQSLRHLEFHAYRESVIQHIPQKITYTKTLPFPDVQLCQFTCDQDNACKGFVYDEKQCYFHVMEVALGKECLHCKYYAKV